MAKELSHQQSELLADLFGDPVVQMMMQADHVTVDDVARLVDAVGAQARPAASDAAAQQLSHYRPCVGVMLLNRNNRVFVGHRRKPKGSGWQMPQGGIGDDETPRAAALRELQEETGAKNVEVLAESSNWLCYDLPKGLAEKAWGGRWRGQRQKWFAMRLRAGDAELHVDGNEFDAWKWVRMAELAELIVPFKRAVYVRVIDEFRDVATV